MKKQIEKQAIEEMAREMCHLSAECKTCQICDERYHSDGELCYFQCVAKEIINHGYRKQEWISVEERLPGVSGRYICAVKDKNGHTWTVAGDYSLEMKKWFGLLFGEIKNTVTHWMPLPEPPKMKGGAEQ